MPLAASRMAMALPIPRLAPVTNATFPSRLPPVTIAATPFTDGYVDEGNVLDT